MATETKSAHLWVYAVIGLGALLLWGWWKRRNPPVPPPAPPVPPAPTPTTTPVHVVDIDPTEPPAPASPATNPFSYWGGHVITVNGETFPSGYADSTLDSLDSVTFDTIDAAQGGQTGVPLGFAIRYYGQYDNAGEPHFPNDYFAANWAAAMRLAANVISRRNGGA